MEAAGLPNIQFLIVEMSREFKYFIYFLIILEHICEDYVLMNVGIFV